MSTLYAIGWFSLVVVSIGVSYLITRFSVSKSHEKIEYWANKKFTTNADILANNEGLYKRIESLSKLLADNAAPYKFAIGQSVESNQDACHSACSPKPHGIIVNRRREYTIGCNSSCVAINYYDVFNEMYNETYTYWENKLIASPPKPVTRKRK